MASSADATAAAARPAGALRPGGWREAFDELDAFVRGQDYRGFDPQDLLASPLVRFGSLGNRWLEVAWTQLGKRMGARGRRLLRVPVQRNPKALGLALAAYVRMHAATGEAVYRVRGAQLAEELAACRAGSGVDQGWGYPFPWANRDFRVPADTPSGVATAFVGHALLDADEAWGLPGARAAALGAAGFLSRELQRVPAPDGTFAFSYTPADLRVVHNASVLAASLLARAAGSRGDAEGREAALQAARFTARAQRPDGSWSYGVGRRNAWVDSFHTSYLLVSLHEVGTACGTAEFDGALDAGIAYWQRSFLQGPAVGFHACRPWPVEQHAVAHAIVALSALRERIGGARSEAERLADWSYVHMRGPDGAYAYRRTRRGADRRIFMRWVQCWMLRALAEVAAWDAVPPMTAR